MESIGDSVKKLMPTIAAGIEGGGESVPMRSAVEVMSAGIPMRYRGCQLEQLVQTSGNKTALEAVKEFLPTEGRGLLLMGPVGTGKTHMAVARLKELQRLGHRCLFVPAAELLVELRRAYDGQTTESDVLAKYANAEVLLLDDLGAERVTEWTKQVFYVLINRRYNAMRSTIVTTNLSMAQLGEVFDPRVVSRLAGMCRAIAISGEDWRKKR